MGETRPRSASNNRLPEYLHTAAFKEVLRFVDRIGLPWQSTDTHFLVSDIVCLRHEDVARAPEEYASRVLTQLERRYVGGQRPRRSDPKRKSIHYGEGAWIYAMRGDPSNGTDISYRSG